jgi:hypothetical protein
MMFVSAASRALTVLDFSVGVGKTAVGGRRQLGMTFRPYPGSCDAQFVTWRRSQLMAAGFPDGLATMLASTPGVDLHALLQLVDRGCPAELAARIIAPIDLSGAAS